MIVIITILSVIFFGVIYIILEAFNRILGEIIQLREDITDIKTQIKKQEKLRPRPTYIPILKTIINDVMEVKTEIKELKNRVTPTTPRKPTPQS